MPVRKCGKKYRIGSGRCMYKSKASAERAYAGYRAAKHMKEEHMDDNNCEYNMPGADIKKNFVADIEQKKGRRKSKKYADKVRQDKDEIEHSQEGPMAEESMKEHSYVTEAMEKKYKAALKSIDAYLKEGKDINHALFTAAFKHDIEPKHLNKLEEMYASEPGTKFEYIIDEIHDIDEAHDVAYQMNMTLDGHFANAPENKLFVLRKPNGSAHVVMCVSPEGLVEEMRGIDNTDVSDKFFPLINSWMDKNNYHSDYSTNMELPNLDMGMDSDVPPPVQLDPNMGMDSDVPPAHLGPDMGMTDMDIGAPFQTSPDMGIDPAFQTSPDMGIDSAFQTSPDLNTAIDDFEQPDINDVPMIPPSSEFDSVGAPFNENKKLNESYAGVSHDHLKILAGLKKPKYTIHH